jgi:hypothetical protein
MEVQGLCLGLILRTEPFKQKMSEKPPTTLMRPAARGISLIETMIAAFILVSVATGLLTLFTLTLTLTAQQGNIASRTTEYSQDKIEQLMALSFDDPGLGGSMLPTSTVGAVPPANPVPNYVDYLDRDGNILGGSTGALYVRSWSISTDSTGTLKTITVVVTSQSQAGTKGVSPSTAVVCMKSDNL